MAVDESGPTIPAPEPRVPGPGEELVVQLFTSPEPPTDLTIRGVEALPVTVDP